MGFIKDVYEAFSASGDIRKTTGNGQYLHVVEKADATTAGWFTKTELSVPCKVCHQKLGKPDTFNILGVHLECMVGYKQKPWPTISQK